MDAETVHIVVGWNDEYEQDYCYEASLSHADEDTHEFEADVPKPLWDQYQVAKAAYFAAERAVTTAAGVELGRRVECCPEWRGTESPGRSFWSIVLSASGDEHTWPLHDAHISSEKTREAAEAVIASWPDEFYVHYGAHPLALVTRDRFSVQPGGWGGSVSACHNCGWERDEHGTQEDRRG